jgi:cytochrome c oxidase cbb3-type subunit 1
LIPKLWNTTTYSNRLINLHFWLATIGILLYITAMWISGIMQGLMWRAFDDFGNLQYAFIESVAAAHNLYIMRAVGGLFFLTGMVIMCFNMYKTIKSGSTEQGA